MKVKSRKSRLITELIEKISNEIKNGSYQKVVARKCGVGESPFMPNINRFVLQGSGKIVEGCLTVKN